MENNTETKIVLKFNNSKLVVTISATMEANDTVIENMTIGINVYDNIDIKIQSTLLP